MPEGAHRRPAARSLRMGLLAGGAACALLLAPLVGDGLALVATVGVAYACGASIDAWRSTLGLLALLGGVAVVSDAFLPAIVATFAAWWIGRELRRRRLLIGELQRRNRELEAEQDAFARLAVRRERARIARELHDIIGHHLAVIVVQAGAGRRAGDDADAVERITGVRASAQEALAEMAHLVDVLNADREDLAPGQRIALLLERARAGGLALEVSGPPIGSAIPAPIEDAAYRIVQESLTNALKHAPGTEVAVRLTVAGDTLELAVRNTLPLQASTLATAGSGLGLTGMRHRVEALGGELRFGPSGGGWLVEAQLPLFARAG